jgi:GTP pyrophosphokinase
MAPLVARHIVGLIEEDETAPRPQVDRHGVITPTKLDPVVIHGNEGASVQRAPCCQPIPGDKIMGQLRRDQGIMIHSVDCYAAKRQRSKEPERWIDVVWGRDLKRRYDCRIVVLVDNQRGILARVAAEIGEADANISAVTMDEAGDTQPMTQLRFTVQVEDRVHLARLMRGVHRIPGVSRILRDRGQ